jgi:pyruvate dehydrogenase E2 component (dihydrolipoamide acetyltransferase)
MKTFNLPDLGEGLQEAEIVAWHVAVGDKVVADQPLVSVETDKAVVEVPSPFSGKIARLFAEAGTAVPVGSPLADFDDGSDAAREDTGTVAGALPTEDSAATGGGKARDIPPPAPLRRAGHKIKATPGVRRLAHELGIDLAIVGPTGENDQITEDDIRRAAAALSVVEPAEPLKGLRKAMAQRMAQAHAEVVPATISDEADISGWQPGTDATIRLAEAIVAASGAVPALNAWYESSAQSLRLLKRVDLGIAVDTPEGLMVPILRDVGARDQADLRAGLNAMKKDAKARTIPPAEMRGATISLSNFGVLGVGKFAQLIVVPPQVAIIGAGRFDEKLVLMDGKPVAQKMLPLSLSFDHRVVTGGEAARFLVALVSDLARPGSA